MTPNVLALIALCVLFLAANATVSAVLSVMDRRWAQAGVFVMFSLFLWSAGVFLVRVCELVHLAQAARVTP